MWLGKKTWLKWLLFALGFGSKMLCSLILAYNKGPGHSLHFSSVL